jgi:hypothetical protein
MPQIKEYTAQADTLKPTSTGVEAFAAAGRRIGAFYSQAGDALKGAAKDQATAAASLASAEHDRYASYGGIAKAGATAINLAEMFVSHQQISKGGVDLAQAHSSLTDAWNNTVKSSDPNDTTLQSKFIEQTFEPWANKFLDSVSAPGARDWAETQVQHLRQHFYDKTSADMSTLAGQAVVTNVRQMTRAWSNTARSDPSAVPFLLESSGKSLDEAIASNPHLTGVAAGKVRTDTLDEAQRAIVLAGAHGAIEKAANPEAAAKAFAARYPKLIDATEADQIGRAAKVYRSAGQADADRAERRQKAAFEEASQSRRDNYIKDIFGEDSKATMKDVLGDQKLTAKDREHLIGVMQRDQKPEPMARVSQQTTMKLMDEMRSADPSKPFDPSKIYDAYKPTADNPNGSLTRADFNFLRNEYANMKTPEGEALNAQKKRFFDGVKAQITKSNPIMGTHDPDGDQQLYRFQWDVTRKVDEYRKAGKDWHDLFDPSKPDYLGKPEALQNYLTPLDQSIASKVRGISTKAPELPAVGDRKKDQTYQTPRGPMKWTGTGWVAP